MKQTSTPTAAYKTARDLLVTLRENHDQAVEQFRWPDVGDCFNWAHDWFDVIGRDNDRPALVIADEDGLTTTHNYRELVRASDQLARWLADHGLRQGDGVLVMLGNQVELWETMLAVAKLGAVILPTTTASGGSDLSDRVLRGRVDHVICNARDTDKFADVPGRWTRIAVGTAAGWQDLHDARALPAASVPHPRNEAQAPLLRYFTSGTTSRPKLVEHTHVSYPVGHLSTMYWLGLRAGDVHLNISSPGWAKHAWSCFFAPFAAEATVLVDNYTRFDARALLTKLRTHHVTTFCAPPTVWRMLIQADLGDRPPALREVIGAGEPLNPEVIERVRDAWGLTIRDGFGQTETTAQIGNTPASRVKPGSMGRPLPGVPVVLVDPVTGAHVDGPGEGEICLDLSTQPVNLMTGYLGDPERDAEAKADGYYHTGDIATRDEDGYITYVGRSDDVFKASDYKISPFELESVLIEHPAVAEAAVVPAPDELRLAVPKAYIALAPGYPSSRETALSVLQHARDRLAPWQRVRRVEFSELPKTISGKIRRVELRQREEQNPSPGDEWRDDQFPELKPSATTSATSTHVEG
jgi:acetyl-CoA synthetase